jgi:hypothetical protein
MFFGIRFYIFQKIYYLCGAKIFLHQTKTTKIMDTMVLERPKAAHKSAGYVRPRPDDGEALGIPWYMTMEEVYAELDQAIEDVECGRCITHEELLKKHPEWS